MNVRIWVRCTNRQGEIRDRFTRVDVLHDNNSEIWIIFVAIWFRELGILHGIRVERAVLSGQKTVDDSCGLAAGQGFIRAKGSIREPFNEPLCVALGDGILQIDLVKIRNLAGISKYLGSSITSI